MKEIVKIKISKKYYFLSYLKKRAADISNYFNPAKKNTRVQNNLNSAMIQIII